VEHDPDLEGRLRSLGGHPIEPRLQSAHLTQMATAARSSRRRAKAKVAGIVAAGVLVGSTSLAAAGALPDPAQHLAHQALDTVGVDVPDPERYHGPECGPEAKGNHGAYVRDDHSLAKTRCGKPVHAGTGGDAEGGESKGPKAAKGPCQGPPPWAGQAGRGMTPEQKAQAQAEREGQCPDDAADVEQEPSEDAGERQAEGSTTTTAAPTTTTTVETTTTTVATTDTTEGTDAGDATTTG
jgi:hypothetical protein